MFFPFTFNIPTPFTNPFDNPTSPHADPGQADYAVSPQRTRRRTPPPRRPIPEESPERTGLSRKRGRWSPDAKARASSSLDLTSTASAYIDSPTKYIDLGEERVDGEETNELRAPKRRRIAELTDSIISTAFSAAVIGTAVGLTAYRLWRDRGKDGLPNPEPSTTIDNLPPPPPYTERPEHMQASAGPAYVPGGHTPKAASKSLNALSTPTPRRATSSRPNTTRRQQAHTSARRRRPVTAVFPRHQSPASSLRRSTAYYTAPTAPTSARSTPGPSGSSGHRSASLDITSGDELDNEDMEISGQMDWMSAQLQALINEGKKALGAEVVVGGQDEVDDGAEGWDDDEPESTPSRAQNRTTTRAASSLARSTSRASRPRTSLGRSGSTSSSVKKYEDDEPGFEVLYQTPLRSAPSTKTGFNINDDGESEELRIAMERVRKAYGLR